MPRARAARAGRRGPRRPAAPVALAAAVLAAAAMACAGAAEPDEVATTPAAATEPAAGSGRAALRLVVEAADGRSTRAFSLFCGTARRSSWPDARGACRRLRAAPRVLAPITTETRDLVRITEHPLTVTGRFAGRAVRLELPRDGSSTRARRHRALRAALGREALAWAERLADR